MKLYSVLISIAAIMIFLGSDQVSGSNLHTSARDVTPEHSHSMSMNTTSNNTDHRSLLPSKKTKKRTRFYACNLSCFNKKKKCKKLCTTKLKSRRAFCWNGHLPIVCRPCCKKVVNTKKPKKRTRFHACNLSCFKKKKKCKKRCTTKLKSRRAFCWNGQLPNECRPCCKKADNTNTPGSKSGKSNAPGSKAVKIQLHSHGKFETHRWDVFKLHNKGTKTRGSACHPGCKRYRAYAYSENKRLFACGGDLDTGSERWASNDPTDCRIRIPYCRHHYASAPCKWEIKEKCT